jgi:hypothetical protein
MGRWIAVMIKQVFAAAIFFGQVSVAMAAARWVSAGSLQGPNGPATIWADMNSMHQAGPHQLEVWLKYANAPLPHGVAKTLVYEHLHCDTNEHATMSLMAYSADGRVLDAQRGPKDDSAPIVPDSVLDGVMPFLCAAGMMPRQ